MRTLIKTGLVVSLIALGLGCAKKGERDKSVRLVRGDAQVMPPNGGTTPGPGGTQINKYGDVYKDSDDAVIALLSGSVEDPNSYVELPIKGIAMEGQIRLQGSTNILQLGGGSRNVDTNSTFALHIIDQMTVRDGIDPAVIGFKPPTVNAQASGSVYNGTQANITFRDDFGDVTITGTFNAQTFSGDISFVNRQGPSAGRNVHLGRFQIATCAIFPCQ